jgi:probable rRNA maturation factor
VEIFLANEQERSVGEARLSALARHVLSSENVGEGAELSVLLITRDHIRQLNARFAGEDQATDVLAFPMMEDDEEALVLGDVVICPEVALRNAAARGHSLDRELDILLVHGTLHLLGYDHQTSKDRVDMDQRLDELLDSFKHARVR